MNLIAGWKKLKEMWSIDVVLSNGSFNSVSNKNDLFCKMFPDSEIAESFSCGKTKCRYVIYFGLAPLFQRTSYQKFKQCGTYCNFVQ